MSCPKLTFVFLICLAIGVAPNSDLPSLRFYNFAHFVAIEQDDTLIVRFSSTTDVDFDKKLANADQALHERTWTLIKKVIVNELVGMIKNNTGFAIKTAGASSLYNGAMMSRGFDREYVERVSESDKIEWFLRELSSVRPDPAVVALYSDLHPEINKQYFLSHMFRITIPTSIRACDMSMIFDSEETTRQYIDTVKKGVIASRISSREFDEFCDKYIPLVLRYVIDELKGKPKDRAESMILAFTQIPFPVFGKNASRSSSSSSSQKDNPVYLVFGRNTEDSSTPIDSSSDELLGRDDLKVAHLRAIYEEENVCVKIIPQLQLMIPALKDEHPVPAKERSWMLMKKLIVNELFGMMINNTGFYIKPAGISELYAMIMASRGVDEAEIESAPMPGKIKWFLKELSTVKPNPIMISVYANFFPDLNKQYFVSHMLRIMAPVLIGIHDQSTLFSSDQGIDTFAQNVIKRISDNRPQEFKQFADEYVPVLIRYLLDEIKGTSKDNKDEPNVFSAHSSITFPYTSGKQLPGAELGDTGNPANIAFGKL